MIRKFRLSVAIGMSAAALACCFAVASHAQQPAATAAADELFAKSDWARAAAAYEKVIAADPGNGLAWQNLGESLLRQRKFDEAIRAYNKAAELRFRPLINIVNVARAQAEKGDKAQALQYLQQIVATGQGTRLRGTIAGAAEFARYKDDAQYIAIVEAITPCRSAPFRQFDFWVGEWEVRNPANAVVGRNAVTLEQSGCLIVEHWESSQGGTTGTSFNYYDVHDRKWHQLYIDNSGDARAFPPMAGEFRDGKMVLISDEKASPVFRWTWAAIAPDRVRQMAEQSTDGQKTWQTTWDSYYVRKAAPK